LSVGARLKVRKRHFNEATYLQREEFATRVDKTKLAIWKAIVRHEPAQISCFHVVVDKISRDGCDTHAGECSFPDHPDVVGRNKSVGVNRDCLPVGSVKYHLVVALFSMECQIP